MKTEKSILRKINAWEGTPMMVAGMYRLFTYISWDSIPEKYKQFFPEEAKETWNEDLGNIDIEVLKMDIESEVRAILNLLAKKNVTQCLGLVPMIFADVFIAGGKIGTLEGKLAKILKKYLENVQLDRNLAEHLATFEMFELLDDVIKKANVEPSFDMEKAKEEVLAAAEKLTPEEDIVTPGINAQVDQALKEYNDALKETEENNNETDI